MLTSHPVAPRASASLFLSALSVGPLLGLLLLAPSPLPSLDLGVHGPRLLVMMTGLVGMTMGCVLGWTLRQTLHAEHPVPASLAQENARLRAQVQAAFELVGVAAHDLGNPLTSLHLRLHRLRGQMPPDARALEGLAKAEREARRMGLMVSDLLDLSRLSDGDGRLELELVELDLAALTREVAERFADQAASIGSALVVHAPAPVRGRWDRQRLDRVATNLLSNALKFGQGRPIEVHVLAEGSRVHLSVRDQGMGIPSEAQKRLFSRFERLGDTGQPGAGLGLYIVRQLVEAHGGTVHVSSCLGEGSTFTVELPSSAS
jgi:signal transduction histidine kinase